MIDIASYTIFHIVKIATIILIIMQSPFPPLESAFHSKVQGAAPPLSPAPSAMGLICTRDNMWVLQPRSEGGHGRWGCIWGFPKIRGTFLGVPVLRIIKFWGLYIGVLLFWEITI